MNKDLKNSIIAFSELADAMSQQGYPGNSEKLKIHMVLVSVAIAAAEGAITEKEMQCIRDYLDYPLTSEILHEKILPNRLDYILTEPPSEIEGFVASEKMAGAEGSDSVKKNADMRMSKELTMNEIKAMVNSVPGDFVVYKLVGEKLKVLYFTDTILSSFDVTAEGFMEASANDALDVVMPGDHVC